jgi:hypothetical protein
LDAAERAAFSLVVDSQLDLQHWRLDASCRRVAVRPDLDGSGF